MSMTPEKLFEILAPYAAKQDMRLNCDRAFVLDILAGLLKNEERYGYRSCPCRLGSGTRESDGDIICPCAYRDADVMEYGSCYCGLYVSEAWNTGTIERKIVPERRIRKEENR